MFEKIVGIALGALVVGLVTGALGLLGYVGVEQNRFTTQYRVEQLKNHYSITKTLALIEKDIELLREGIEVLRNKVAVSTDAPSPVASKKGARRKHPKSKPKYVQEYQTQQQMIPNRMGPLLLPRNRKK
tara:strand:- start:1571 stop:1957 length:387 start_codon:yes stop_codon:yes gene_type:complete